MVEKIDEIILDGVTHPLAFTTNALEHIENDLGMSYTELEVNAKTVNVLLYRGVQDGYRAKKIPFTISKEQLADGLFMNLNAFKKLWATYNKNISFGEATGVDEVEDAEVEKKT